jgi:3',5'-cyclic AMP phosphodiesterase CpdA
MGPVCFHAGREKAGQSRTVLRGFAARRARTLGLFGVLALGSCSHASEPAPPADPGVPRVGKLADPVTDTTVAAFVPKKTRVSPADTRSPSDPSNLSSLVSEGWGEYAAGAGSSVVTRTLDGTPAPAPGPQRKRAARFAHVADLQLADDESPARFCAFDAPGATGGAFRPNEAYACRVLNAVVRTVNRIHESDPLDFLLLGGDNADNAQKNEFDWVLGILNGGGPVACDSGDKNDLVPGPNNDPKDPFLPEGLGVPWLWVTGNHDVLQQGNFPVTDDAIAAAVGADAMGGTRDYAMPGGPISHGPVVADANRVLLHRADLMARITSDAATGPGPKGHGLGEYATRTGRAFYTFDVPNSPVTLLVLDTAAETGGAEGILRRGDFDGFVKPAVADAATKGRWVVVTAHHPADAILDGSGFGGTAQQDAVPTTEWNTFLTTTPNIVASFVGHGHVHRVRALPAPVGSGMAARAGVWEIESGAVADYQNDFRIVEIWDEDDGYLSIRTIDVDYATTGDAVAQEARTYSVLDWTIGWSVDGPGHPEDRNTVLFAKKP